MVFSELGPALQVPRKEACRLAAERNGVCPCWKVTDCWGRPKVTGVLMKLELAGEVTISSETSVIINRSALASLT